MYIRTTVFLRKRAGATRLLWLDGFFYGRDLTKDPWAWAQKQGAPPRQRVAIPFLPHRAPADREPAVTTHAQMAARPRSMRRHRAPLPAAYAPTARHPEIRGGSSDSRPLIRSDHFHFLPFGERVPVGCAPDLFCFRGNLFF